MAKNEAFQSGEHVMYDLYFNWKFIWKKVGLASLTTNATIYDVLIALCGGLAGIIALSTKEKGNVIPGVAIATALMPPKFIKSLLLNCFG